MLTAQGIQAKTNTLYNTANSLDEAWHNMKSHAPKGAANEFFAHLMIYHNTLVRELSI
ncbi:hypothetical protein [Acinetobacter sp. A47]|uniref:DUF6833 domain-containing protein n=1 Tax=Acinetobacter sp. A47 TaxID=1561217 RepID=UPI0013792020|nr:hypothetical protein [Acinetobacter sp. A47]